MKFFRRKKYPEAAQTGVVEQAVPEAMAETDVPATEANRGATAEPAGTLTEPDATAASEAVQHDVTKDGVIAGHDVGGAVAEEAPPPATHGALKVLVGKNG